MRPLRTVDKVSLVVAALLLCLQGVARCEDLLRAKDTVAICGDSITEQKIYSVYMETYLLACKPATALRPSQFGWSGETAPGFLARIKTDILPLTPTIATTCYGMNDGHYTAMTDATGNDYRKAMQSAVAALRDGGVRTVVVGAPGCVDTDFFNRPACTPQVYNETLGKLADIAREIAAANQMPFADVHGEMMTVMAAAKQKYGNKFTFAGSDGIHPQAAGHLVMAYAFLKALGCGGDIGTITVDLAGGKATASDGHEILSSSKNSVEIASTRYPFCFLGDGTSPTSERSVVDLFPFNADLNRFTLVINNAGTGDFQVTWGTVSKKFTAADLSKGINLAAEFEQANPFTTAITELESAVGAQQAFETTLTKTLLHSAASTIKAHPETESTVKQINADSIKLDHMLLDAAIKKASTPIHHTIKIERVQ